MPVEVNSSFASRDILLNTNILFKGKLYLIDYTILNLMKGILLQKERIATSDTSKNFLVPEVKFTSKFDKRTNKYFIFEKLLYFFKYGKFEKPEEIFSNQTILDFINTSQNSFLMTQKAEFFEVHNEPLEDNPYYLSLITKRQDITLFVRLIEEIYLKLSNHLTETFPSKEIYDSLKYICKTNLESLFSELKYTQIPCKLILKLIESYAIQSNNLDELLFEVEGVELKLILIGCSDNVDRRIQWLEKILEYPETILMKPRDQFILEKIIYPLLDQRRFFDCEEWVVGLQSITLSEYLYEKYKTYGLNFHAAKWATREGNEETLGKDHPDTLQQYSEVIKQKMALEEKSKLVNLSSQWKAKQIIENFFTDLLNHDPCLFYAVNQLRSENLDIKEELILNMIPFYIKRRIADLLEQIEKKYVKKCGHTASRSEIKLKFFLHYSFQIDASFLNEMKIQLRAEVLCQFASAPEDYYKQIEINQDSIEYAIQNAFEARRFIKSFDEFFSDKYSLVQNFVVKFVCDYMQPFVYRQIPKEHDFSNWVPITEKLENKLKSLGLASRLDKKLLEFVLAAYICKSIEVVHMPTSLHFLVAQQIGILDGVSSYSIACYLEKETDIALKYLKIALEEALTRDLRSGEKFFLNFGGRALDRVIYSQMKKIHLLQTFQFHENGFFNRFFEDSKQRRKGSP